MEVLLILCTCVSASLSCFYRVHIWIISSSNRESHSGFDIFNWLQLASLYFQIGRRMVGALYIPHRHLRFSEMPL